MCIVYWTIGAPCISTQGGSSASSDVYKKKHLDSDIDMVSVIRELLAEEQKRLQTDDSSNAEIFIRPDHGHQMMDDIGKEINPGYSAIGRLKGLAEVRGVIQALSATL